MAVTAQRRISETEPVVQQPKKRKRRSLLSSLARHPMACVLLVAAVICLIASAYVGAYAGSVEKGRSRAALIKQLANVKLENEKLRSAIEGMSRPEQIEAFAIGSGMTPCTKTAFLEPEIQPHVAQNSIPEETR